MGQQIDTGTVDIRNPDNAKRFSMVSSAVTASTKNIIESIALETGKTYKSDYFPKNKDACFAGGQAYQDNLTDFWTYADDLLDNTTGDSHWKIDLTYDASGWPNTSSIGGTTVVSKIETVYVNKDGVEKVELLGYMLAQVKETSTGPDKGDVREWLGLEKNHPVMTSEDIPFPLSVLLPCAQLRFTDTGASESPSTFGAYLDSKLGSGNYDKRYADGTYLEL